MSSQLDNHLDIKALMEMGFSQDRVEQALRETKGGGIPGALEWLFSHPVADSDTGQRLGGTTSQEGDGNAMETDSPATAPSETTEKSTEAPLSPSSPSASETQTNETANSLKCEECNKLLKGEAEATMHAARSGHSKFAESTESIKPLTEEQKIEQRKRLQDKLEERRKQRIDNEKEQDKLREKNRRKTGQEISKAKDDHARQEMMRIADQRKKEKMEERRIKQQIKEQIAKDRENLKMKQQNQRNPAPPTVTTQPSPTTSAATSAPPVKKEYDTCRIQFRLPDGRTLNSNFNASDTLFTVHEYVSKNRTDGRTEDVFTLSTTFPRKTFNDDHMLKSLKELGLVPSSVLVLGKVA